MGLWQIIKELTGIEEYKEARICYFLGTRDGYSFTYEDDYITIRWIDPNLYNKIIVRGKQNLSYSVTTYINTLYSRLTDKQKTYPYVKMN
jgi:hypothetical protein